MKACAENGPSWPTMTADKREAIHMILHKVSRIVNGDPEYADSWRDISGYATLVLNRLERK